ncbi:hypothetical protein DXG01_005147 [Tephrocybe rancida]|nr:hypothetical protein DXG01_005147 [Tephrocybe rancida]
MVSAVVILSALATHSFVLAAANVLTSTPTSSSLRPKHSIVDITVPKPLSGEESTGVAVVRSGATEVGAVFALRSVANRLAASLGPTAASNQIPWSLDSRCLIVSGNVRSDHFKDKRRQ